MSQYHAIADTRRVYTVRTDIAHPLDAYIVGVVRLISPVKTFACATLSFEITIK